MPAASDGNSDKPPSDAGVAVDEAADALVTLNEVWIAHAKHQASLAGVCAAHRQFQITAAAVLAEFGEQSVFDPTMDPLQEVRAVAGGAGLKDDGNGAWSRDRAAGELADLRLRILTNARRAASANAKQSNLFGAKPFNQAEVPEPVVERPPAMPSPDHRDQPAGDPDVPSTADTGPGSGSQRQQPARRPRPFEERAYSQYQAACAEEGVSELAPRAAYEIVRDRLLDDGESLPEFLTWAKYQRSYRQAAGIAKSSQSPRRGRDGRSIVRADEID